MNWYSVKTYERPGGAGAGHLIDASIFEATDDRHATDQMRQRSLLAVRGDFANLLLGERIIATTDA